MLHLSHAYRLLSVNEGYGRSGSCQNEWSLPPASAVEVIESVSCFCVSFRLSVIMASNNVSVAKTIMTYAGGASTLRRFHLMYTFGRGSIRMSVGIIVV